MQESTWEKDRARKRKEIDKFLMQRGIFNFDTGTISEDGRMLRIIVETEFSRNTISEIGRSMLYYFNFETVVVNGEVFSRTPK